jgi:LDH2 family malate/lactate/ureidoglycolate dehydrogenase
MVESNKMTIIQSEILKNWITTVFETCGFSTQNAQLSAKVLVDADLRGIDSHGVARLSGYVRLIQNGRINTKPNFIVTHRKKTMIHLDADGAIGLLSAPFAMNLAMEATAEYGSGWSGISNSNHFGIAAYHAMMALEKDFIGFAMTNASPLVTPSGGKQRMLGTNPICVAVPTQNEIPFVLDMATAAAANGKLEIAERSNKPIPEGWAITQNGEPTTDAKALKNGGILLPLGSNKNGGYHKGYGLGSWVDIFSGVLTGANFGPWVPPFVSFLDPIANQPGKGIGHFVGCWDMDGFQDKETTKKNMDLWIQTFKNTVSIDIENPVLVPGEIEHHLANERSNNGIPLVDAVCKEIEALSIEFKIKTPL